MKLRVMNTNIVFAPKIIIDQKAKEWMKAIVDLHETEVGFYALSTMRDDNTFFISDVYYPKHNIANLGHCEIADSGQSDFMRLLISQGREDDVGKIKVWGHSHVDMGISPSKDDHDQAMESARDNKDYFIRLITNKKHQIGVSFYDYKKNLIYDEVDWEIEVSNAESIYETKVNQIINIITANQNYTQAIKEIRLVLDNNVFYQEACEYIKLKKEENMPQPTFNGQTSLFAHSYDFGFKNDQRFFSKKNKTSFTPFFERDPVDQMGLENLLDEDSYYGKGFYE